MYYYSDEEPIVACSTGIGQNAAIAVIRLSGFKELNSLAPFFSLNLNEVSPQHSYLTDFLIEGKVCDQILLLYFSSPRSYTGENVLELSVHGNILNVENIIQTLVHQGGFRHAGPGEFTFRALKNKKLSLSQVEGLDLLLNATSSFMLAQGQDVLRGTLQKQYQNLHQSFLKLKMAVELSIDFLEDIGEEAAEKNFTQSWKEFSLFLSSLHQRIAPPVSALTSPDIVLVGQTNAGKSSLFNRLLQSKRAIVSSIPGTTRDYLSENLFFANTFFRLIDTAGIRESSDPIERQGIERSLEMISSAFFKVLVVNPLETDPKNFQSLHSIPFDLLILTHKDLEGFQSQRDKLFTTPFFAILSQNYLECNLLETGPIGPTKKINLIGRERTGPIGPEKDIQQSVLEKAHQKYLKLLQQDPIIIGRHRELIQKLYELSCSFETLLEEESDIAIISSELNVLGLLLDELVGIITPNEVLNSIFENFCIGK